MNGNLLPLWGTECAKCSRPAKHHDFRTGNTTHVSPFASNCQTHPPRPITEPRG